MITADRIIRWTTALAVPRQAGARDPLQERAAEVFADQLAADRVPSGAV